MNPLLRRLRIIVVAGLLVTLAALPAHAIFDGTTTAEDAPTVQAAALAPIAAAEATRDASGTATVGWSAPATRPEIEPEYAVERTLDGVTETIAAQVEGHGFVDDLSVPATIEGKTVTQITAGGGHSCALAEGRAYCWGLGANGQLGDGSRSSRLAPVAVAGLTDVTQISAGESHTCAIDGGRAYCWGIGGFGQLGRGDAVVFDPVPGEVPDLSDVTHISAGRHHTCAIAAARASCWGFGANGRLGEGATADRWSPVSVTGPLSDVEVTHISAGEHHNCAIASGLAYCWGQGTNGRLGHNSTADSTVPVRAGGLFAVTDISAGGAHSCAIAGGGAYCWGQGDQGQLGDFRLQSSPLPVVVRTDRLGTGPVRQIDLGDEHSCAVAADGSAHCWGYGGSGQLGVLLGSALPAPAPVAVEGPLAGTAVVDLGIGRSHSCAISAGAAYCWGHGGSGRLGDGATANRELPVAVQPGAMGGEHICADNWQLHDDRCVPGPSVAVSYRIGYAKRGWQAPATVIEAGWSAPSAP